MTFALKFVFQSLNRSSKICDPNQWSNSTVLKFQETRRKYAGHDFDSCSCASGSLKCPESVNSDALPRIKVVMLLFLLLIIQVL